MELPSDFNSTELELFNYLQNGRIESLTTVDLYRRLDDPADKFLVAYIFELGNTRKLAEEALGMSKATIWKRIKKIKRVLREYYKI